MNHEETAVVFFGNNFNCSQAVFAAFAEELGMDVETALKIGTPFGSGARRGEICGAVSGALMVLGLKYGHCHSENKHLFNPKKAYGYGKTKDSHELTETIANMYRKMLIPAIAKGACGCIYTQLSDVEDEINGLYTYDRKVCKVEKEPMRKVAEELYAEIKS